MTNITKFYVYNQNNSGGSFDIDDNLDRCVVIEAINLESANDKALTIGIYFDGVFKELDCECCGDRWYDSPSEYENIESCRIFESCKIHYLNGTIESKK